MAQVRLSTPKGDTRGARRTVLVCVFALGATRPSAQEPSSPLPEESGAAAPDAAPAENPLSAGEIEQLVAPIAPSRSRPWPRRHEPLRPRPDLEGGGLSASQ